MPIITQRVEMVMVALSNFFDIDFFRSLVSNLLAVLIGAAIGIPIGLALNRAAARHSQKLALQIEEEVVKRAQHATLEALKTTISFNEGILSTIITDLSDPQFVAFYDVDTLTLNDLVGKSTELLNPNLISLLGRLRYELNHLSRKLKTQYDLAFTDSSRSSAQGRLSREVIVRQLPEDARVLLQLCSETLSSVDAQLQAEN